MSAFEHLMNVLHARGEHVISRGGEARTRGICHDGDAADTVSIRIGNNKNVVIWCHKCQGNSAFLDMLGLNESDLYDEPRAKNGSLGDIVGTWTYLDVDGSIVQYVHKYRPKAFRPELPDGQHRHPPKERRVLLNLPAVRAQAEAGGIVVLCEGETDADKVTGAGYVATTPPGGAGMGWQDRYTQMLAGVSEVRIIADRDHDDSGIKYARKVVASLRRGGVACRIYLPAVGKDVSDHLAAQLTMRDLVLVDPAPELADIDVPDTPEAIVEQESEGEWEEAVEDDKRDRFPRVDWKEAFTTDFSDISWLPGRFMERGQQATLVGDGKVGKSLLVLDWIWRAISGQSALGDIRREPINVLYFDRENSLRDIITRLTAFGATEDDLETLTDRFDYRLFPRFSGSLNASATAAAELLEIVAETPRDIVIFDTVSRYISGKENDSDTWLSLYDRVHAPLKGQGIAALRLDHFGKDVEKGVRGSSAKTQDVDHVWELTAYDENRAFTETTETIVTRLKMLRTHTRTGLGDDVFHITRRGEKERGGAWLSSRTRHELTDSKVKDAYQEKIQTFVNDLVMRGVPEGLGREHLKRWAEQNGASFPGKTTTQADVVTALKAAQKPSSRGGVK